MRKIIFILFGLFIIPPIVGQNINNHWILDNTDMDLNTNPPTINSESSKYGFASVSDENGDLLFYFGKDYKIYNKNHLEMGQVWYPPAYKDALRNPVVILPMPTDSKKYVVYGTFEENFISTGKSKVTSNNLSDLYFLGYSLVDFNTNPLGEVKYGELYSDYSSYLVHSGGPGTGLLAIRKQQGDGYYLLYLATHSYKMFDGTPLYSNGNYSLDLIDEDNFFPQNFIPQNDFWPINGFSISSLKIKPSPDFSKIAGIVRTTNKAGSGNPSEITYDTYKVFVVSFDESNLSFSNFLSFGEETFPQTITNISRADVEFSTDGQKIYYIKNGDVYVKDLSNLLNPDRKLSEMGNSSNFPNGFEHLQRDKFGNIWIGSSLSINNRNKYLHKIENQNSYTNSSINLNSVYLLNNTIPNNYNTTIYGLPYLIPELVEPCYENLLISANVSSGNIDEKQASDTITASNIIENDGTAIYHAGNSVVLSQGFNAKSGSNFRAYIEGCTNIFSNKIKNYKESNNSVNNDVIKVKLYPNPNNGVFELFFENITYKYDENVQIEIYNINSKLVEKYSQKISDDKLIIDKQNLQSGIYLMRITSKSMSEVVRFIIK